MNFASPMPAKGKKMPMIQCFLKHICLSFLLVFSGAVSSFAAVPSQMAAGDLDLNGLTDLAILNPDGQGMILINNGNDSFTTARNFVAQSSTFGSLSFASLTGQGIQDLLMLYPDAGGMEILWGTEYDQLSSTVISRLGVTATSLQAQPAEKPLIAIAFSTTPKISLLAASQQTLQELYALKANQPVQDLLWMDLEPGGEPELITIQTGVGTQLLGYRFSNNAWNPFPLGEINDFQAEKMTSGLLNKDQFPDLLLWSSSGRAVAMLGTETNTFKAQEITLQNSSLIRVADVNADSLLDIILITPQRDAVILYLNQGDLNFQPEPVSGLTGLVSDVLVGYFSDPSVPELLVWTEGSLNNSISPFSSQPLAETISALFRFRVEGNIISPLTQMNAPDFPDFNTGYENVSVYKKDDLAQGIFFIYRSFSVPDWTTGAGPIAGGSVQVEREILADDGLTSATPVTLTGLDFLPNQNDYEAHVNQFSASQSEFSFGLPKLPRTIRLQVGPPSGSYNTLVVVEPDAEPGVNLFYQLNGGTWNPYTPGTTDIVLFEDGTVAFYAEQGGEVSEVVTRVYQVNHPPYSDYDKDGIPDELEEDFALEIASADKDYDDDGWDDLDELIRGSDPKDPTSMPLDTDMDGWADFDETIRQTNPSDPESTPVALGVSVGEYSLNVLPAVQLTADGNPSSISENSYLSAYTLAGSLVLPVTSTEGSWQTRLSGEYPYFLRIREKSANTVTLLGYSASHAPCWDPAALYDGTISASEWLELGRQEAISNFYITRNISLDYQGMAAALLLEYWLSTQIELNLPIELGKDQPDLTYQKIQDLKTRYHFDSVYAYFHSQLNNHPWTQLVQQVLEWARNNPPARDVDVTLQALLWGQIDAANLPPAITAESLDPILTAVSGILENPPSKEITISGTIAYQNGFPALQINNINTYALRAEGASLIDGSNITINGILENDCPVEGLPLIRVMEIQEYQPILVYNTTDADGDGLADQWEQFYFGRTNVNPNEDPDNDGFDNAAEFAAFTNPADSLSLPSGTPPTPTPSPTEVPPTPTPTEQIPVPTPTEGIPTPTPVPTLALPVPLHQYSLNQGTVADAGFTVIPGGFVPDTPPGEVSMGNIPSQLNSVATDGTGMIFTCDPGEVQMVMSQLSFPASSSPVIIRANALASSGAGAFSLVALDGSMDGSLSSFIPTNTNFLLSTYKRLSVIYEPNNSDSVNVILQLAVPPTANQSVTVYVDNIDVIPFTPGTAITPQTISLNGIDSPVVINTSSKPVPIRAFAFNAPSIPDEGWTVVPGGFIPGTPAGDALIGNVNNGGQPAATDGRALILRCDPGEVQMLLLNPAIDVGNVPVFMSLAARSSQPYGALAIAGLEGNFDGSLTSTIPIDNQFIHNIFKRMMVLYEPHSTSSLSVIVQLSVPASAPGPVEVHIDNIQIIPFTNGTIIEASDLNANAF
jgi:hypothetical protein